MRLIVAAEAVRVAEGEESAEVERERFTGGRGGCEWKAGRVDRTTPGMLLASDAVDREEM